MKLTCKLESSGLLYFCRIFRGFIDKWFVLIVVGFVQKKAHPGKGALRELPLRWFGVSGFLRVRPW